MSRYYLDLFGCVKNQVDAENMSAHLNNAGWECVTDAEKADLIIVNSCGFIKSAKQESINAVLEWRKLYPEKKILLAGCLAQRYEKELSEDLTEADAFMGVGNPPQILEKAEKMSTKKAHARKAYARKAYATFSSLSTGERPLLSLPGSAYVKISEGCSNRCSYCAIPLIRGELVSRKIPDILDECSTLLTRGIRELCIIGQDIGAFGMDCGKGARQNDQKGLFELLNAMSMLEGNFWVRLLYIHPDHFPLQVFELMKKDKRFLPYFDIPFQHASSKILCAMNRKGTAEKYLELIKTIRIELPDAVIRSTFLLGFPGETEDDFDALLDFQQKANLDWLGCFAYSREEGTDAFSMKGRVPAKIAAKRKQIIEERQIPITEKNMERFVGQTLNVLIEEQIDPSTSTEDASNEAEKNNLNSETIWLGRLYCQAPDIDGAAVIVSNNIDAKKKNLQLGSLVPCKVINRRGIDLKVSV